MRSWLVLALFVSLPASAGVVINELYPNPTSTDAGYEWVELYNDGASAVDLSGWTLQAGTSSFATKYTFPALTSIDPGDFLVVGEEYVGGADLVMASGERLSLGNASSNADAVRLVNVTAATVDTVVYGTPNDDGWVDDTGAAATSLAPMCAEGGSIARASDGVDTNASGADFVRATTPTMGGSNGSTGTCDAGGVVKINEFVANPSGADTDLEWVELYNVGGVAVDLADWSVATSTNGEGGFTTQATLPAHVLEPGAFVVVGGPLVAFADLSVAGLTIPNGTDGDALRIVDCAGSPRDTVAYGDNNDDLVTDDSGAAATSLVAAPGDDEAIARITDGADTDRSGDDFELTTFDTPGASNEGPSGDCGASSAGVVINEVLPNPAGDDDGAEWIELYGAGDAPVDLTGWSLQTATSSWSTELTFDGVTLAPGEHLLVGGALVAGADVVADGLSIGNGTDGDGVRLADCYGVVADTLVYGANNDDAIADDSGEPATSLAAVPGDAESLARIRDGYDTDTCAVDFVIGAEPTPGAENPIVDPMECVPSAGTVTINELLVNPSGDDATFEWIELYNGGDSAVSVAGWWLTAATQLDDYGAMDVSLPAGATVPAGGWLVIGGEGVPEADIVATFSLGNGTDGDALVLYDCEGAAIDTVVYGDGADDGMTDDNGEVAEPYGDPGDNQALARVEDGADSDAAEDWRVDTSPSPGASNYDEGWTDTGDDGGGRGCGRKDAPDADAPGGCGGGGAPDEDVSGGCATAPLPMGGLELAALVFVARRRRCR